MRERGARGRGAGDERARGGREAHWGRLSEEVPGRGPGEVPGGGRRNCHHEGVPSPLLLPSPFHCQVPSPIIPPCPNCGIPLHLLLSSLLFARISSSSSPLLTHLHSNWQLTCPTTPGGGSATIIYLTQAFSVRPVLVLLRQVCAKGHVRNAVI